MMWFGRALLAWQTVEFFLSRIFVELLRCKGVNGERIASAAFFTPRDFSVKLNMTLNVAKLALSDAGYKTFRTLRNRCEKESQYRNALAHYKQANVAVEEGSKLPSIYLERSPYNPNNVGKQPNLPAKLT